MKERNYDLKFYDFTPFIGHFIYQIRNLSNLEKYEAPKPYSEFIANGLGLIVVNLASGFVIVSQLEKLLK